MADLEASMRTDPTMPAASASDLVTTRAPLPPPQAAAQSPSARPRMRWRVTSIIAASAFVVSLAGVGVGVSVMATNESGPNEAAAPLIEQPVCFGDEEPQEVGHVPVNSQRIIVVVPQTAWLEVDAGGHIVAAASNTGCAPRPDDTLFYKHADGSLVATGGDAIRGLTWQGDFTNSGVFVPQVPSLPAHQKEPSSS